jgi:proline-rich protein PRCC
VSVEGSAFSQRMISARAKGRHQLSSLLSDAQKNRADLEERIARSKANRKAGGGAYGA